ncbi:MAG: hypothetical protein IKO19_11845 [Candidatus Riflebacteria bacterium]|nr:hypothetical protein [Candidatus Riflebacteria bacterium]
MKFILKRLNLFFILLLATSLFISSDLQAAETASDSTTLSIENFPKELLYPEYFRIHDMLLWENIRKELIFKFRFFTGKRPQKDYIPCHKFQRRISRAIDRASSENKLTFSTVDNKLLFDKNSDFEKILSPQPTLLNKSCNYHSLGDINKGCILYCDYHGIDFESEFYKQNKNKLEIYKPLILPEDVAELIIFLPSILVLMVILFLILPKKKKIQMAK